MYPIEHINTLAHDPEFRTVWFELCTSRLKVDSHPEAFEAARETVIDSLLKALPEPATVDCALEANPNPVEFDVDLHDGTHLIITQEHIDFWEPTFEIWPAVRTTK